MFVECRWLCFSVLGVTILSCCEAATRKTFTFSVPLEINVGESRAASVGGLEQEASSFALEVQDELSKASQTYTPTASTEARARSPPDNKDAKESQSLLTKAVQLFNAVMSKSEGRTAAEQAIERDVAEALNSENTIGKPIVNIAEVKDLQCLPDLSTCPKGWLQKASLCIATDSYSGKCVPHIDFVGMAPEQKVAYARQCQVEFKCQEDCPQDFRIACPSMWREVNDGICEAPLIYVGSCSRRINAAAMSDAAKLAFGMKCGTRWPCVLPKRHIYDDTCPEGWTLEFGQTCSAPANYSGPCASLMQMHSVSVAEKKEIEASCDVQWPGMVADCVRDFGASCPYGWYQLQTTTGSECRAPLTYRLCSKVQSFDRMSPDGKRRWEASCQQKFPCKSRIACVNDWAAACPAEWFAVGDSCLAPTNYKGNCSPVLRGLLRMPLAEKTNLAHKCDVEWPCVGEAIVPTSSVHAGVSVPMASSEPARYALLNGPVDGSSGTVLGVKSK